MKNISFRKKIFSGPFGVLLVTLAVCFAAYSCGDDSEGGGLTGRNVLVVGPGELEFGADDLSSKPVAVATDAATWKADKAADGQWIEIFEDHAAKMFTVAVAENTTGADRSATITVTAGDAESKTVTVKQSKDGGGSTGGKVVAGFVTEADKQWAITDELGVCMIVCGELLSRESILENADNVPYTVTSGGRLVAKDDQIHFPLNGTVDFISYYPFNSAIGAAGGYTIKANVADQADQGAIELLYSNNARGKSGNTELVTLAMNNMMSKIVFDVIFNDGLDPQDMPGMTVGLEGIYSSADFSLVNGEFSNLTTATSPVMSYKVKSDGSRHQFTVLPMDAADARKAIFTIPGQEKYAYEIPAVNKFEAGKSYTITVHISKNGVSAGEIKVADWDGLDKLPKQGVTPALPTTYKVGDYYPDPEADVTDPVQKAAIKGVVFWVDPASDGLHGKVVNLKEAASGSIKWATASKVTGANNTADGQVNMATMKAYIAAQSTTWGDFPLFSSAVALNPGGTWNGEGDWYIPARDELQHIYCALHGAAPITWTSGNGAPATNATARSAFNDKLTNAGGDAFVSAGGTAYYWSSSEVTGGTASTTAVSLGFSYPSLSNSNKSTTVTNRGRAIMKF